MKLKKKITDHTHNEYIFTAEFNKLAADVFNARLSPANLVTKTDFDNKLSCLNTKIVLNKTRDLSIEKELEKLNTFDISYFRGKNYFEEYGTQNCLYFNQWVSI